MSTPQPSSRATGYVRRRSRARGDAYYAHIRLPDGTRKQPKLGKVWTKRTKPPAGYLTEGMAEARLAAILAGDDALVNLDPIRVTFGQAIDEWLSWKERECRPSTMHDYRSSTRSRIRPFFGESTLLEDIDTRRVQEYHDHLAKEGLSGRTINKHLTIVYGIFGRAMRQHGLAANPVQLADRARQRKRKVEQWLNPNEVLLLAAKAPTPMEAALYKVAAWTGLRWGELRALRWGDVDFSGGYINVNRNWPCHGDEDTPKSGKPRAVPLWDQAAVELDDLSRRENFTAQDDYVFCNAVGEPLGYDWAIRRFKTARDDAGLKSPRANPRDLTFHDLRHSYGTLAARIYKDLRIVQEYMGHASITTTELYAHFVPRHDAAAKGTEGLRAMLEAAESEVLEVEPAR